MSTASFDTAGAATDAPRILEWLAALDHVETTLRAGAMAADVGCGRGFATVALAEAFPRTAFTGYDPDDALVRTAAGRAVAAGVRNARFEVCDPADIPAYAFDLVTTFGPTRDGGTAQRIRACIAAEGTWMLVEQRAAAARAAGLAQDAGFTRVRIAAETGSTVVLEARP